MMIVSVTKGDVTYKISKIMFFLSNTFIEHTTHSLLFSP